MSDQQQAIDGASFHQEPQPPVYDAALDEVVIKRGAQMALVHYQPCHFNPFEEGDMAGHGSTFTRWIFSEDGNKAEGLSRTAFNLMVDFRLEPDAALGLHRHDDKEEIYYLLEGSLRLTVESNGQRSEHLLLPGDAHFIRLGQAHGAVAGPQGARVIAVCVRPT